MWEISNSAQAVTFLYSLILGLIFCVFYDILRAIRYAFKFNDLTILFQDIFYFVIISFITFIFLLSLTNGEIRAYVLIGILLGFIICLLTFSRFFTAVLKMVLLRIKLIFDKVGMFLYANFSKLGIFIEKIYKNIENSFKKGLKKVIRMLYTKGQSS